MTDVRVVSIGTLAVNPFWHEQGGVRTGHATTTLIRDGDAVILVDPGLPPQAVVARLFERSGLQPSDVTHVFLTSFQIDCRRGLEAFEGAEWLLSEREREAVGVPMAQDLKLIADAGDAPGEEMEDVRASLERNVAILSQCRPAPDKLSARVDLFPLNGITAGMTGLLITEATKTTLVCGDAVPTVEHVERGQILQRAHDVAQARESLAEALEIADVLVLGRDNAIVNPTRRAF